MALLHFCCMPFLSLDYSNVIDFENSDSRKAYFDSKKLLTLQGNIKNDSCRTYINVDFPFEEVKNYDYLYVADDDKKPYYYFIIDVEYVTKSNCNIYVKLDVWTTYLFNYTLMPSFVDRCHVDRWNGDTPTENNQDEEIDFGTNIQLEREKLIDMGKSIILTSSVPIGYIKDISEVVANDGTVGTSGGASGDFMNGIISADCLLMNKGYEGFDAGGYDDGFGTHTIGYGITKYDSVYETLCNNAPITESEGARACYNSMNTEYGSYAKALIDELGLTEQYQFDAIVLRMYNAGVGSVTTKLKNAILSGNADEIVDVWSSQYVTSNGIPVAFLKVRRKEEGILFTTGKYVFRTITTWHNGKATGTITANDGKGWLPSNENTPLNE